MKLLFIYGSSAVGKLTTADEIAKLITGSKVFHNHLTIDAVKPVFEFGLIIDNTYSSAIETAKRIIEHFQLNQQKVCHNQICCFTILI